MPGQPTFNVAANYDSSGSVSGTAARGGPSHNAFILWVVIVGVVLPIAILGGLKVSGFSFVFKGR